MIPPGAYAPKDVSTRWVLIHEDLKHTFERFDDAKLSLLDDLWWWSRDVIDIDPPLHEAIMKAWGEVAKFDMSQGWANYFSTNVYDTVFHLVRSGCEGDYIK